MHSLPKCIKTGKKRPEFFSKYKGALYSLPPFKLLFLHIFVYSQFCLLENSSFHVLGQTKSPLPVNANAIGRINSPIPVTSCIKSVSSYTSILQSTKKDIFLSFFDKNIINITNDVSRLNTERNFPDFPRTGDRTGNPAETYRRSDRQGASPSWRRGPCKYGRSKRESPSTSFVTRGSRKQKLNLVLRSSCYYL